MTAWLNKFWLRIIELLKGIQVEKKEPPVILVKTWYSLLIQKDDMSAKERGKEMLLGAFGDMQSVAVYLKKHKIVK